MTASAALLAVFAPLSASAQVVGSLGQRGAVTGAPSGPVINRQPVYAPPQGLVYRQTPSYPQPVAPQVYGNGGASVYPSFPPNRVFSPNPSGGDRRIFSPPMSSPGQEQFSGPEAYQTVPPGLTYRNFAGPGSRGGQTPDSIQRGYQSQQPQRGYTGRLIRPAQPGANQAQTYEPIYGRSIRVTTPTGQRSLSPREYNNYIYAPVTIVDGASLLGGYYYGNYSNTFYADGPCYPSVYSSYPGFPEYIVNPGVIVLSEPYYPAYVTPPQPFYAPVYQVTYNQNNYYVASEDRAQQIQDGGATAARALKSAYPEGSFQAAFGDVQQAWKNGDISLLRKHVRDSDTTLSVYFGGKYSYSIASSDFVKITRDAFDRLSTVSFDFTRLRKAKNGDVTAYGKHVYRTSGASDSSAEGASTDNTVPFSTDGSQPYDRSQDPAAGATKTIYVSYTLRKHDDQWFIIGVDSSPNDLVK